MKNKSSNEPPGKIALTVAAEFIKYTVALGTGSLVFSVGLLTNEIELSCLGKIALLISWIAFSISIATGILAYSRIPVQLSEKNYDIEDKWFVIPGRIHQSTFVIGIVCLGVALIISLFKL